jgi:hypothetical protein
MSTIIHAILGYIFLLLIVRLLSRRPGGQLTLFEFVIVFLIGGLIILGTHGAAPIRRIWLRPGAWFAGLKTTWVKTVSGQSAKFSPFHAKRLHDSGVERGGGTAVFSDDSRVGLSAPPSLRFRGAIAAEWVSFCTLPLIHELQIIREQAFSLRAFRLYR